MTLDHYYNYEIHLKLNQIPKIKRKINDLCFWKVSFYYLFEFLYFSFEPSSKDNYLFEIIKQ